MLTLFTSNALFLLAAFFVVCNWILGGLSAFINGGFEPKTFFLKGLSKVIANMLVFVFLFASGHFTKDIIIWNISPALVFDFIAGVMVLYYIVSAVKNGIAVPGLHFAVVDTLDTKVKELMGKSDGILSEETTQSEINFALEDSTQNG
ncbi:MAG: hypothetical protein WBL80_03960 [Erysipelotrichaceae bacterium]